MEGLPKFKKFKPLVQKVKPASKVRVPSKPPEHKILQSKFLNGIPFTVKHKPKPKPINLAPTKVAPSHASVAPASSDDISHNIVPTLEPVAPIVNTIEQSNVRGRGSDDDQGLEAKRRRKEERKQNKKEKKKKKKKKHEEIDDNVSTAFAAYDTIAEIPICADAIEPHACEVGGADAIEPHACEVKDIHMEDTNKTCTFVEEGPVVNEETSEDSRPEKLQDNNIQVSQITRHEYREPKRNDWILYRHNDQQTIDENNLVGRITTAKKKCAGVMVLCLHLLNCDAKNIKVEVKRSTYGSHWRFANEIEVKRAQDAEKELVQIEAVKKNEQNELGDKSICPSKVAQACNVNQEEHFSKEMFRIPEKQDWIIYQHSDDKTIQESYFMGRVTNVKKKQRGDGIKLMLSTVNCVRKRLEVEIMQSTYGKSWLFATKAQIDFACQSTLDNGGDEINEKNDEEEKIAVSLPQVGNTIVHRHNNRQSLEECFVIAKIIQEEKRIADTIIDVKVELFNCIRKEAKLRLKLAQFESQWRYATDTERLACVPQSPSASSNDDNFSSTSSIACVVCGKGDDAPTLLLCDRCNRGTHLACFQPPLLDLPKDDEWLCDACAWKMDEEEENF